MEVFLHIDLNLYMSAVCVVIFFSGRNLMERQLIHNRIFRRLILSILCLLIIECGTWMLDGAGTKELLLLDYFVTILLFLLTPLPGALWALYVKSQIFLDKNALKLESIFFGSLIVICAVFTLLSPITKLMFYFDSVNIYHRGVAYPALAAISLFPVLYATFLILLHRKKQIKRNFLLLSFLSFLILGSALAQILFYGLAVIWSTIVIAALLVHTNIQNDQAYKDHLTGIFNRRQLDMRLFERIQTSSSGRAFSCIMLDINRFKSINDTLGHIVGDDALISAATILKSSIRKDDFLSRYGGDEFVILSEIEEETVLTKLIDRINDNAVQFNSSSCKPYSITFSMGYAIYHHDSRMCATEFLNHVDMLMYQNKQSTSEDQMVSDEG